MTVIDLSEQIDDICSRYPKYWLSDEAQRELLALWGGPDCNDCGVFERDETLRIDLDGTTLVWRNPHRRCAEWLARHGRQATGTGKAEADHRLPSGTGQHTQHAMKPSPPALAISSPSSRACTTVKATHRKTSLTSHNA